MNKTQINYFEERMFRIQKSVLDRLEKELPMRDRPDKVELAGMIATGKARFKEEMFTGPNCPSSIYLFDAFEFPGEDDRQACNSARSAEQAKIVAKVKEECRKLIDQFVLERITFEEAAAKLENMKFWKKGGK